MHGRSLSNGANLAGEEKSGPVETGLTKPVTTALVVVLESTQKRIFGWQINYTSGRSRCIDCGYLI